VPELLRALAALSCAALFGCGAQSAKVELEHPNIVVIYVDDLGWGDVGYHGSDCRTPHIDRLASQGVELDRFYASPMCTPSRAQLLTGRHALRTRTHRNIRWSEDHGLPQVERTLADCLLDAGYATSLVGKWHLGHRRPEHHPLSQGFEHYYGHLSGWIDYQTHERNGQVDWWRDGQPSGDEGYATDLLAAEAVRTIETREKSRPLFLCVTFNAPHAPIHLAPGRTPRRVGEVRLLYETMVASLDDGIGAILDAIESEGISEDTLVFFASDNGGDTRYGASNGTLRGDKFTTFEGGVRTPAILSWPGRLTPGRSEQFITNLDILPTLCSAAGVGVPEVDGVDLADALLAGEIEARDQIFFYSSNGAVTHSALLTPPHKLVREAREGGKAREWLFDVAADEREERDLSGANERLRAELSAQLTQLEEGLRDSAYTSPPGAADEDG